MKEKIVEFFENYSHWILYGWFVALFIFMSVLFLDASLLSLLGITGIALGSTATIAWAIHSHQMGEQDRLFREQQAALGAENEPVMQPRVRAEHWLPLKKTKKSSALGDILSSDEIAARLAKFHRKHKK